MNRIKVGDIVIVRSGNDKNRHGKVVRIFNKTQSALVEGVRVLKKCVKANPSQNLPGGIISKEYPILLNKLQLYNPTTNKKDKVVVLLKDGKKARYFRSNQMSVDVIPGGTV